MKSTECRAGNSYLYIKDAKSYFDEPREKLPPRSLCGRGTTIARSLKDFVAKVYTTFCVHPELKKICIGCFVGEREILICRESGS
jgi:hypothetical protein